MHPAIVIGVNPGAEGGWTVSVGDGQTSERWGNIPRTTVATAMADVRAALGPQATVLLRNSDAARTRREEQAGRALASLLQQAGPAWAQVKFLLGVAQGRGLDPVVVVDAADVDVRALPWELLAADAEDLPLETLGAAIARRAPGHYAPAHAAGASALQVIRWSPTPGDPTCARLTEAVDGVLAAAGLPATREAHAGAEAPDRAIVLQVVCHGEAALGAVALMLDEDALAAGTALHVLAPVIRRACVVVFDVCEAGAATTLQVESLAGRFIAGGAAACIAPIRQANADALAEFARGFYPALARGGTLRAAVAAGRRAVRDRALPGAESRWCNQAWFVRDLATAVGPGPVRVRWRPPGWPVVADDLHDLLEAARAVAERSRHGYVGLEHLAVAVATTPVDGTAAAYLRHALHGRETTLLAVPNGMAPEPKRVLGCRPTPRLCDVGRLVPAGATAEQGLRALLEAADHPLYDVGVPLTGLTRTVEPFDATRDHTDAHPGDAAPGTTLGPPATRVEVRGGPEDGRVYAPRPGEHVGRWDEEILPEHALYEHSWLGDRALGRHHLRYVAPGEFVLARRARRILDRGYADVPPGPCTLHAGEVLALTRFTQLVGRE